jgi:hypothetical protein
MFVSLCLRWVQRKDRLSVAIFGFMFSFLTFSLCQWIRLVPGPTCLCHFGLAKRSSGQLRVYRALSILFLCRCFVPDQPLVLALLSPSSSSPAIRHRSRSRPSPEPRLLPFSRALLLPSRPRTTGAVLHLVSLGVQHEERGRRLHP